MKMKGEAIKKKLQSLICSYMVIIEYNINIISCFITLAAGKPGDMNGFGGYFEFQFFWLYL